MSSMALFLLYYIFINSGEAWGMLYSNDVYFTLYGNITSFDNLFEIARNLVNSTPQQLKENDMSEDEVLFKYQKFKFDMAGIDDTELNETGQDHAHDEFVRVTNSLNNHTRRNIYWYDMDDTTWGLWREERKKEMLMRKLTLSFLMHSRYEIAKAFQQRTPMLDDKRYKIGYLFNKIRRIKTEQVKLLWLILNRKRNEYWFEEPIRDSVQFSMIIYEQIAAYDVDLRDICRYIKELHAIKQQSDIFRQTRGTSFKPAGK